MTTGFMAQCTFFDARTFTRTGTRKGRLRKCATNLALPLSESLTLCIMRTEGQQRVAAELLTSRAAPRRRTTPVACSSGRTALAERAIPPAARLVRRTAAAGSAACLARVATLLAEAAARLGRIAQLQREPAATRALLRPKWRYISLASPGHRRRPPSCVEARIGGCRAAATFVKRKEEGAGLHAFSFLYRYKNRYENAPEEARRKMVLGDKS